MERDQKDYPGPAGCQGELHPMARRGLELFNAGQYWKAHEALEEAWREEPGEIHDFYRGLLQVGVAYLHIERSNYTGALKLYHRCQRWLAPFPAVCQGVNLNQVRQDLEAVVAEVRRLGPDHLDQFDRSLLKPIQYIGNKP